MGCCLSCYVPKLSIPGCVLRAVVSYHKTQTKALQPKQNLEIHTIHHPITLQTREGWQTTALC